MSPPQLPLTYRKFTHTNCSSSLLYFSIKFHENILNGFQAMEDMKSTIVEFQRGITPKVYRQELLFLCSAHLLTMLYISMKFQENILNDFQVIERT